MADFHVKPKQVRSASGQIKEISRKIERLNGQVETIMRQNQIQSSAYAQVMRKLKAVNSSLESEAKKVKYLSGALEDIVNAYERAENRLLGNTEVGSIREQAAQLRNEIAEVGGILGMDSAALYSSDPVNLSNGNYVYEKNFFTYDTIISMNFRMFYNACGDISGALGKGWHHNFEREIIILQDTYRVVGEDGVNQNFNRIQTGEFIPMGGTVGILEQRETEYIYTDDEKVSFHFNMGGKLTQIITVDGWKVQLHYEENLLKKIDCTDGISLNFIYDSTKKVKEIYDHAGRKIEFGFVGECLTKVKDPAGNLTTYEYDEKGRLYKIISPSGELSVQNTYDEQGRTIKQEFADGGIVTYRYHEEENAVIMRRQNESEVTYIHDDLFRNTKTVYTDGEEVISYNDRNQRTSFTDKLGRVSKYRYDAYGRLSSFFNALGNEMSFSYNEAGQLTAVSLEDKLLSNAIYDELGHQIANIDANGTRTGFVYDALGRVTEVIHEDKSKTVLCYDNLGNVISVQDPVSGCTTYEYDECHRVICSTDALGNQTKYEYDDIDQMTKVTNAEGYSREYSYDSRGNLTKVVDFNGGIVTIEYNAMNRPVSYRDADGNTTLFEYDKMSNPIRKTAADGGVTEYIYDTESRMTEIRHPMGGVEKAEYDAVGNLIKRCAADGGEYRITYDALDRPIGITDPENGVRSAEYDILGNVTSICYEDGTKETFTYDLMGNRLSYTDQSGYSRYYKYNVLGKIIEISDDEGILERFEYGPGGKLVKEQKINGEVRNYRYDTAGNVIQIEDSVNGIWNYKYNSLGQVSQAEHVGVGTEFYTYDGLGNITAVVDGEGNKTLYQYSIGGALEKVTDAKGVETGYKYDSCYRLKQILQPENGHLEIEQTDEYNKRKIRTTTYEWDLEGNVVSVIDSMGTSVKYSYDACGRITSKQDQDGNVTSCFYRKDGTEEKIVFQDGRTIKYQYDALKRLSRIEDWLGITRISRDEKGRVTEVTDHEENSIGYTWNDRGQCTSLSYPDGRTVAYQYDKGMRLSECISENSNIQYKYYDNGQLQERKFSNEFQIKYSYDKVGRISGLTHLYSGAEINQLSYAYDACSRKNRIHERRINEPEIDYQFSYDKTGCLTDVIRNGERYQSFEYDIFGNRNKMWKNGVSTTYGYDELNRLQWSITEGVKKTFIYDKRGNMTSESVNGIQGLNLYFDALNRLTHAVSDQGEADYVYNGLAMLTDVQRMEDGHITNEKFLFDYTGMQNVLLTSKTEKGWENFVWDRELILSDKVKENNYFIHDERMSNCGLVTDSGVDQFEYDVFGNYEKKGIGRSKFGFGGYRYDNITGYYDGGWRQYDASNGRFISQDPVAGSLLVPITLNPYIYCLSDPVNITDPTGKIAAWLAGGIVGAVVNIGTKFAGDVVNSIKEGEWKGSSWQSYVGTAAGGFVQGTVFVMAGPTAAGAAGAATETFITNGLNMATGQEGYRKEDGYGFGKLLGQTAISGAEGAITGFTFGKAAEYIKIPKITSGRGNASAVWKQVMTKARKGLIANVSLKTLGKGLLSYGLVKTADTMIDEGIDAIKDGVKGFFKEKASDLISKLFNTGTEADNTQPTGLKELIGPQKHASCATT